MTFGSLFAGIGGFDLGFERAGMRCVWQVEIDDYANRVLEKHWPDVRRWRDVRSFPPAGNWSCDVICGGFPCQDISYAGRGAGIHGERSGLFFEAVRVVRQLKPRIVVLENVAALLSRGLDVVLGTLAEIGYDAEWHCIPASAFGAPHIRDRVFVLGYAAWDEQRGVRRARERVEPAGEVWDAWDESSDLAKSSQQGFGCSSLHDGNPARPSLAQWWSVEPDVGRVDYGVPARVDRLRCLGNAVVPQVAEWIGRRIVECER